MALLTPTITRQGNGRFLLALTGIGVEFRKEFPTMDSAAKYAESLGFGQYIARGIPESELEPFSSDIDSIMRGNRAAGF